MDYISKNFKRDFPEHFAGKVYRDNVNGRVFFQYQPLKDNYLKTISEHGIYVSDPSDFNDPFDCWGLLVNDLDSRKPEEVVQSEIKFRREVKRLGVVCLTSSWDNQLMWSHYAGSHTGICLGFKFSDLTWEGEGYLPLKPVQYSNVTPVAMSKAWNDEKKGIASQITTTTFVRTKIPDWHYEREWRLICKPEYRGRVIDLSHFGIELSEIVFGKDVSPKKREEVINYLNGKQIDVEYYEAVFDRNSMNLAKNTLT